MNEFLTVQFSWFSCWKSDKLSVEKVGQISVVIYKYITLSTWVEKYVLCNHHVTWGTNLSNFMKTIFCVESSVSLICTVAAGFTPLLPIYSYTDSGQNVLRIVFSSYNHFVKFDFLVHPMQSSAAAKKPAAYCIHLFLRSHATVFSKKRRFL